MAAWFCVLLIATIPVIREISLSTPRQGWRMKFHETAEALDALVLASKRSGGRMLPDALRQTSFGDEEHDTIINSTLLCAADMAMQLHVPMIQMPYREAQSFCKAHGGKLASARSPAENAQIAAGKRRASLPLDLHHFQSTPF